MFLLHITIQNTDLTKERIYDVFPPSSFSNRPKTKTSLQVLYHASDCHAFNILRPIQPPGDVVKLKTSQIRRQLLYFWQPRGWGNKPRREGVLCQLTGMSQIAWNMRLLQVTESCIINQSQQCKCPRVLAVLSIGNVVAWKTKHEYAFRIISSHFE